VRVASVPVLITEVSIGALGLTAVHCGGLGIVGGGGNVGVGLELILVVGETVEVGETVVVAVGETVAVGVVVGLVGVGVVVLPVRLNAKTWQDCVDPAALGRAGAFGATERDLNSYSLSAEKMATTPSIMVDVSIKTVVILLFIFLEPSKIAMMHLSSHCKGGYPLGNCIFVIECIRRPRFCACYLRP